MVFPSLEKPSAGSIHYLGKDITHEEGFSRASSGFGYVPQGRQIFPLLTVEENLSVALSAAGLDQQSIPKSVYDTFPVLYDMRNRDYACRKVPGKYHILIWECFADQDLLQKVLLINFPLLLKVGRFASPEVHIQNRMMHGKNPPHE